MTFDIRISQNSIDQANGVPSERGPQLSRYALEKSKELNCSPIDFVYDEGRILFWFLLNELHACFLRTKTLKNKEQSKNHLDKRARATNEINYFQRRENHIFLISQLQARETQENRSSLID